MTEDFPALRLGKARGDFHQGRLAGAVTADKADAFAGLKLQVGARKQRRAAEAQVNVIEFEDRRSQDHTPEKSLGRANTRARPLRRLIATSPSATLEMVRDEPNGK